jgi:hypothetical protein
VDETRIQIEAAMEPMERALFHLRVLLSMTSGETRVFPLGPDIPWEFTPGTTGNTGYVGTGTNSRNVAIQFVMIHIAALTFNQARAHHAFDSKDFGKAAVRVVRIIEIAKMYGAFSDNPKNMPPAMAIKLDVVCKLVVEIALYRVYTVPVITTSVAKLETGLQKLGTIFNLLEALGELKISKAWAKWVVAVNNWYTTEVCLYVAHHMAATETVVDNPELTAKITKGEDPSVHFTEARMLLEVTKQTHVPLYAYACEKEKTLAPWRSTPARHTPVVLQSIVTGAIYHTFTPGIPTIDQMPQYKDVADEKARRTMLLHATLPMTAKPVQLVSGGGSVETM